MAELTPSKKKAWVCKICKDVFKDAKSEILECEKCEEHCCKKCLKLTSVEYKAFAKRPDFHWFCPPCETKTMKNVKIEKEVELRCKEYFAQIEGRVKNLETKIDEKVNRTEVAEMIKSNAQVNPPQQAEKLKVIEEIRDSEMRKNNIVIYGLEESKGENAEARKDDDHKSVEKMCSVMVVDENSIQNMFRMGKLPESKETDAKPRPIKIEFRDETGKQNYMKGLKHLKSDDSYKKVSVVHDMTPAEREENRKRVLEAKERNEKETSENHRHIVVGPARERRVIRVKKKA